MHRVTALLAATALATGAIVVAPDAALAGKGATASCGREGCDSEASNTAGAPTAKGRRHRARPNGCSYVPLKVPPGTPVFRNDGTEIKPDGPGRWYEKRCFELGTVDAYGERMFTQGSFRATPMFVPARTPAELRDEAFGHLALPVPAAAMSPANDQVVQFPTWLWVDDEWAPLTSTVSVPGVAVTVTATPERVVWNVGDGATVVCGGPGRPYDPSLPDDAQATDCSHTYTRTGDFRVTARTDWHVTWSVEGAPGGGDLGVVSRSTPPIPVRVEEVQALNVHPRR